MDRALYLVSYDIRDDRERVEMSQHLLGYTAGRQKSVYECWLTHTELENVRQWVEETLETVDKVHIFKLPPAQDPQYLGTASSLSVSPIIIG
ncbi:CRISPR-associated endonuclease Cas2 [Ignatzschineria ureiclastica]|uniref:CRISPR-associated endoribonuclease Cas2 n=1 Tax=Ignatzschineria ureiclastica TaxID=472582 RepID=A0A2U2AEZ8_9GAMM|nr:CRISPR-associated endonuclease Cas2 [Ignatzschineria ureiclastica]PWD81223.1 CRISPR-associated endonuclease Cas2 [Ignatzschineria ureiclastica]GGZ97254.1 CRISPR-associated endoribonuclease Cas2 1 [Ignatzschineria ureiclastica]